MLRANPGMGRTTVLRHIHETTGGALLGMRRYIDTLMLHRPDAIEQAFVEMVEEALAHNDIVVLDDLHLVAAITNNYEDTTVPGCSRPRSEALLGSALAGGGR